MLVAAFWNYINLFVNTFARSGFDQLWKLLQTGRLERPDLLIALVAVTGHSCCSRGVWLAFCECGETQTWVAFCCGGLLAVTYFVAIVYTTGQQYIPLIRRTFGF